jgi:hypothetical protein
MKSADADSLEKQKRSLISLLLRRHMELSEKSKCCNTPVEEPLPSDVVHSGI